MHKLFLFLFLCVSLFSKDYILDNGILMPKTVDKLVQIGEELEQATSVSLYAIVQNASKNKSIKEEIKTVAKEINNFDTQKNILILLDVNLQKIEMLFSQDLDKIVDKDSILDDYIIPLLASEDKNAQISKYSAAMLNGYSETAEVLASHYGVELNSTISSGSKDFFDIFRYIMYFIFSAYLSLFVYKKIKG